MLQHLLDEAKYYPKNLKGREHAPLNRSTEDSFIQFQFRPKVKYSQIPEKVPGFEFKTIDTVVQRSSSDRNCCVYLP